VEAGTDLASESKQLVALKAVPDMTIRSGCAIAELPNDIDKPASSDGWISTLLSLRSSVESQNFPYHYDMKRPFHRSMLLAAALLALSACSTSADSPQPEQATVQEHFSDEDKRIARALSLGGDDILGKATPQYEAALCSLALAAIEDSVKDRGLLSSEQRRALRQAEALYQRRAVAGLSAEELEQTRNDVEADYPEPRVRARFAIGCLRDLG
jgi:hypothetical protein